MFSKTTITLALGLALLAMPVFVAGCGQSSYANRVVSVGESELTFAEPDKSIPKTHEVAPDATVTLDKQPAALEDLENGDRVKLTIQRQGDQMVITSIDAVSKDKAPPARTDEPERQGERLDTPNSELPLIPPAENESSASVDEQPTPEEKGDPVAPEDNVPDDGQPQ